MFAREHGRKFCSHERKTYIFTPYDRNNNYTSDMGSNCDAYPNASRDINVYIIVAQKS